MVEVVAALIVSEDGRRFLLCRRAAHKARGGLWEFVGGKVELGESKAQALIRECREELDVVLAVEGEVVDVTHEYPDLTVHLTLLRAHIEAGEPKRLEHQDIRWVSAGELDGFALCPADREIVSLIRDRLPE